MASEDEEWEPLTEVDMKLLQARRERSDQISKRMGDYLLKGYKMLAITCPKCDTILLQTRQGDNYCVTCSELDTDVGKDDPVLNASAAQSLAREAEVKVSVDSPPPPPAAMPSLRHHRSRHDSGEETTPRLPNTARSEQSDSLGMTSIDVQSWPADVRVKSGGLTTDPGADGDSGVSSLLLHPPHTSSTIDALMDKVQWASQELRRANSVEYSIQLCTLIKTAAEAVVAARTARI